jgi:MFS family permease
MRFDPHGFAKLSLCYGALGFGYIVPATFLPAMARAAIADPAVFGWTWPIFGIAAALSTVAAAPLARAIGYRRLWILANVVMAAGVAIPLASTGVAALLASAILVGATFMVITMAGLQEARRLAGPRSRSLIAGMTSAFALGQILGPIVVSVLSARGAGYEVVLMLAAIALVVSSIALATGEKEP